MLRDFIVDINKAVPASYVAAADLSTGMGVVLDDSDNSAKFPSTATADMIYFVDKERVPVGANAARTDMSDYDVDFNTYVAGQVVKVKKYNPRDVFGTDAKGTAATKGKVLTVGTDGLLVDAGAGVKSRYRYVDDVIDNGHKLMKIMVLDEPVENAESK